MKFLKELSQQLYVKAKEKITPQEDWDKKITKWNEIASKLRQRADFSDDPKHKKAATDAQKKLDKITRKAGNDEEAEDILKKRLTEWNILKEIVIRNLAGKKVQVKKIPVRMASGKVEMHPPGKSGSSGGGD